MQGKILLVDRKSVRHICEHAAVLDKGWSEYAKPKHTHIEGQNTKNEVSSVLPKAEGKRESWVLYISMWRGNGSNRS